MFSELVLALYIDGALCMGIASAALFALVNVEDSIMNISNGTVILMP